MQSSAKNRTNRKVLMSSHYKNNLSNSIKQQSKQLSNSYIELKSENSDGSKGSNK